MARPVTAAQLKALLSSKDDYLPFGPVKRKRGKHFTNYKKEPEGLFGRLADEEMLAILKNLSEREQFSCRAVSHRWLHLTQDPQLIQHSIQAWKEIRELFNTNFAKFVEALDRLRDCLRASDDAYLRVLADNEEHLPSMPITIKNFQVEEAMDELILSYEENCSTREQQVQTMNQRELIRKQLSDRTAKLWGYIKNSDHVTVVNCNPFGVSVPVRALMLEPLHRIINELPIPRDALPKVVVSRLITSN